MVRRIFLNYVAGTLAGVVAAAAGTVSAAATASSAAGTAGIAAAAAGGLPLRVMSFNIRYKNAEDARAGNGWDETRRVAVAALIRRHSPDILGTQEVLPVQRRDLVNDLPEYDSAGIGRGANGRGEQCAVFFKRNRFTALETRNFWISETPDTPPAAGQKPAFGAAFTRIVTGVRLKEKRAGGREFWFLNTHFDHISEAARVKAGELVIKRLETFGGGALPVVLTGDFNCVAGTSETYKTLTGTGAFLDSWTLARSRRNADFNSFQAFSKNPRRNSRRIDWVLLRPAAGSPSPTCSSTEIVIEKRDDGGFPSDHFPVIAEVVL